MPSSTDVSIAMVIVQVGGWPEIRVLDEFSASLHIYQVIDIVEGGSSVQYERTVSKSSG
jgi:hypothetical protein